MLFDLFLKNDDEMIIECNRAVRASYEVPFEVEDQSNEVVFSTLTELRQYRALRFVPLNGLVSRGY